MWLLIASGNDFKGPRQTVCQLRRFIGPIDSGGRQGLCELANNSRLYIGGEFVGGCDIISEMYINNELQPMLDAATPADG